MYKALFTYFIVLLNCILAQSEVLDDFESVSGWKKVASDQVDIKTSLVQGRTGKAIKINYNFISGSGYCGIQKEMPMKLPHNFQFSFYIKGDGPANNLEFKLVDKSGLNVWWLIQRSYEFPGNWQKVVIKKRHISFAWGPIEDKSLKEFDKIEFFISSANGGKGSYYLDDFHFEELDEISKEFPEPYFSASSSHPLFTNLGDGNLNSVWKSSKHEKQFIEIDLKKYREFGGLVIDWDEKDYAEKYQVQISNDGKNWETVYSVKNGKGGRQYIYLKDLESKFIKLLLTKCSNKNGYIVKDIKVKGFEFSESPEKFFNEIAKDKPRGYFPKYNYNEQSYWTITGVSGDEKEALINEEGMVETDKRNFSVEPFIFNNDKLLTWNNVKTEQKLEDGYLPIPVVEWNTDQLNLTTKIFASGKAGSSVFYLTYKIRNCSNEFQKGKFFLAIRPFQVNPPWQFLNNPGGTAKINSIDYTGKKIIVNGKKKIIPLTKPDTFGAAEFDEGDITEYLNKGILPTNKKVIDNFGYASGALSYQYELNAGEEKEFYVAVPFYNNSTIKQFNNIASGKRYITEQLELTKKYWKEKLNNVEFNLPQSADKIVNTIKSNLAYILINRDGKGIQPGSRSYERSWIRDGSLTSSALLKMGITDEVKEFINWYSSYQFPNGKVPCVVDKRGPDPVPENDSHGQLVLAFMQYFNFTKDTSLLKDRFVNVIAAMNYMDTLISQRKTDYYKNGNDSLKALYGLMPESISHEGYSDHPRHSYWDDFFGLKGMKDAVEIAKILGKKDYEEKFVKQRDEFQTNIYNSIRQSIKNNRISYIPGCAELGDFDATSTTTALSPVNEYHNIPQPYLQNTFDIYYENFTKRLDPLYDWTNYTPYEVRVIGSYIYLNQVERAHELVKFFLSDQRPVVKNGGWNHWAEVVWKDKNLPRFIGDMPHTWVGSDFINSIRSFFVYEDELDNSLVVGAGLYKEWVDSPEGISIKNLPTYYGPLNYSIKKEAGKYIVNINGEIRIPAGGIKFINPAKENSTKIIVNQKEVNTKNPDEIVITEFPATIEIYFEKR